MVELGVFFPVTDNGYIVSTAAPPYQPSFAMIRAVTRLAEDLGFHFVLSPVKYRGFGGPTEFADYVLESFEVMAALAQATARLWSSGNTVDFDAGLASEVGDPNAGAGRSPVWRKVAGVYRIHRRIVLPEMP